MADPYDDDAGAPPPRRKKADLRCHGGRAVNGCRRAYDDHRAPWCEWCGRPHEHHAPGDVDAEVEGRARMAAARRAAGTPLDALDKKALDRHPHPRSSLLA